MAIACTLARQRYYPMPTPSDFYSGSTTREEDIGIRDGYYAWTWGEALFVVLDPFWYTGSKPRDSWEWTLGKEQYDWLKATLEGSVSKYKFVFIHHLTGGLNPEARGGVEAAHLYEWGGSNADGTPGCTLSLTPEQSNRPSGQATMRIQRTPR
jgi:hypothetical protein